MENLIRNIREASGLNQADFARLLGRSVQMLQLYERSHAHPPAEIVEKLKDIAAQYDRADLAVAFQPGEIIMPAKTARAPASTPLAEHQRLHALLDEILDSNDQEALRAVVPNLELFARYVRAQRAAVVASPQKRRVDRVR